MYITSFSADGFRNLNNVRFSPDAHLNVISGDNAQGKTNLLDAIWMMTGCRNFHGAKDKYNLGFDKPCFVCKMQYFDGRRELDVHCVVEREDPKKRHITVNGVDIYRTGTLFEAFHCVAFSPSDVELINGSPDKRRSYMDLCACQLRPNGIGLVSRASRILNQRNAGLQIVREHNVRPQDAAMWDNALAMEGARITCMRASFIRSIAPLCKELYGIMTGGRETLDIRYKSNIYKDEEIPDEPTEELTQKYRDVLEQEFAEDIRVGYTRRGIQRDEMILQINGNSVQLFGSQGQRKSTALVLKLAQAHLYNKKRRQSPIILLDDVMGELDERRQKLIYDMVSDMQVFMTLCQPSALQIGKKGKVFRMENGELFAE